MNYETRKFAITIAAVIFAARALTDWDGKRSPRFMASVYDAVEKAKLLVSTLEGKVLLLIVALSIVPAAAHADSVYTVTSTLSDPGFGIAPTQFRFTQPTIASSGFVTSGLTQISGGTATAFS